MSALLELAERVEALTRPDRWLDGEIYVALNIPAEQVGRIDHERGVVGWHPLDAPYQSAIETPPVTASLDAALTLVPRGWIARIIRGFDDDDEYWSTVVLVDSFSVGRGRDAEDERTVTACGSGEPARFICAASLRARAAGESA